MYCVVNVTTVDYSAPLKGVKAMGQHLHYTK
jgi:hypothetical protein